MMEMPMVRLTVSKGTALRVMDLTSSDPYLVVKVLTRDEAFP